MTRMNVRFAWMLVLPWAVAATAAAQTSCPSCSAYADCQTYRIVYQMVYEPRTVTAYRIENETVVEERQITAYKPVWETAVRENRYTVAHPVAETAVHDEVYTVQRPVCETAERDESYTVMRPVYETAYQTQYRTVYQPVTTYRTQYVDHGCASNQMVFTPALPLTRLAWQSGGCAVDPVTGQTVYRRAGLYWTQTLRGEYTIQPVWHPNVVAQQIPQTSLVPQTVAEQIPTQVCKYQPEVVVRKVPVQICRMVTEQCVRKVPVTTYRMAYEERVEQVPYQVCRMVAEAQTIRVPHCVERRVPVTYTYNVARLVCYRVPLDSCGEPLTAPALEMGPPAVPGMPAPILVPGAAPATGQPTPARRPDGANRKPEIGSETAVPRPIDGEENPGPQEPAPLKKIAPPKDNSAPGEAPSLYPSKST